MNDDDLFVELQRPMTPQERAFHESMRSWGSPRVQSWELFADGSESVSLVFDGQATATRED